MKLCKLTTQDLTTHNGFQWELGVWREANGTGTRPCSPDVLHFYHHPILAVLFNMIHACINNPRLFEIEIDRELGTDGLKGWCKKQRLVKEIKLPKITFEQRTEFAIRVVMLVYSEPKWLAWAEGWLDGSDRKYESARTAYSATHTAARDATVAYSVANAAICAINAAIYASNAGYAADAVASAADTFYTVEDTKKFLSDIIKIAEKITS